jgi:hypothetical protein
MTVDPRTLKATRELGDGELSILGRAKLHTSLKHLEESPLVLEIEIEDPEKRRHIHKLIVFPDHAEGLARGLLLGLARLGRTLTGEELQDC